MITVLLIVALVAALIFAAFCYIAYNDIKEGYEKLQKKIDRKYIKVDVILRNAIYEAVDSAIERGNEFEAKGYKQLLKEIQGKW